MVGIRWRHGNACISNRFRIGAPEPSRTPRNDQCPFAGAASGPRRDMEEGIDRCPGEQPALGDGIAPATCMAAFED